MARRSTQHLLHAHSRFTTACIFDHARPKLYCWLYYYSHCPYLYHKLKVAHIWTWFVWARATVPQGEELLPSLRSTTRREEPTLTAQHCKRGTYPHCAVPQGEEPTVTVQHSKRNLPSLRSTSRRGTYPHCAAPQERNLPSLRSTARREEPTLTAQHRKKRGTYPHCAAPQEERTLSSLWW